MILVATGQPYEAVLAGYDHGRTDDLLVQAMDGDTVLGTATEVRESVHAPGLYIAKMPGIDQPGDFLVSWTDSGEGEGFAEDIRVSAIEAMALPGSVFPTRSMVGALLRARTVEAGGHEVGTFTDNTRPTGTQVDELIQNAAGHAADTVGANPPEKMRGSIRGLVALRTAMLVELSYFPDDISTTASPYDRIKTLYDERLKDVERATAQAAAGEEPGAIDEDPLPAYTFPEADDWDHARF